MFQQIPSIEMPAVPSCRLSPTHAVCCIVLYCMTLAPVSPQRINAWFHVVFNHHVFTPLYSTFNHEKSRWQAGDDQQLGCRTRRRAEESGKKTYGVSRISSLQSPFFVHHVVKRTNPPSWWGPFYVACVCPTDALS